jgi:hypothetical protein
MTARNFERDGIPFLIAVEPQDADEYAKAVGRDKLLILPFSNLGLGSYPARNYCWDHAKAAGHQRHWIFDDNIDGISKWQNGRKPRNPKFTKEGILYVERHADAADPDITGFEYRYFVARPPKKPFKFNTHVYSAMLIRCDLPYRWRLKYNEDVDLCLQVLHNGGRTSSCVYYMSNKKETSAKMKGGNQDELYKGNNPKKKLLKAKMLESVWPQYAKTVIRFNRYHHFVDWKVFSKQPKKQPTSSHGEAEPHTEQQALQEGTVRQPQRKAQEAARVGQAPCQCARRGER